VAGLLVSGEPLGHITTKFRLNGIRTGTAVAQDDKRAGHFAGSVIGASHNAAVAYCRVLEQDSFDLGGSDGEALVFDQFFSSIDDVVEPIGVGDRDVSGPVPAVTQNGLGGFGSVPVSGHE